MHKMKWCTKCTTPNTRPRIEFDAHGVCNACTWGLDGKKNIDWKLKEQELQDLIADRLREAGKRNYDVLIPVSGGKDSHYQVWYAKNKLKLRVLAVNIEPLLPTKIGLQNRDNIAKAIGVDMLVMKNNPQVYAKLTREMFIEHGNPYIPFLYALFSGAARIAQEKNIPLFMYGENGETEYGGSTSELFSKLDNEGIHARIIGNRPTCLRPEHWSEAYGIPKSDLLPYLDLDTSADVYRFFLADFIPWNNNEHLHYALNVIGGFKLAKERTTGSYTHGYGTDDRLDELYLWFLWVKFGFHRSAKYAAKDIREGKLTREKACELVRLYDGEFPWESFDAVLNVLNMQEDEFWNVARRFVGDEENLRREALEAGHNPEDITPAWEKIGENTWRHLAPIHGEQRILQIPMPRMPVAEPETVIALAN